MPLDDLLAPLSRDQFLREFYNRRPLHIARPHASSSATLDWTRFNDLLAIRSHWREANINLILNSRAVHRGLYMDDVQRLEGSIRLANLTKVHVFLSIGASLVANSIEDISPEIRAITSTLSHELGGRAGANVYCSFKGIQAFASHCDLHEVFALQCEGEKVWRIYENRAVAPVDTLTGTDAQKIIDSAKGRVAMEVRLRPGDLLYIPRGYYHDALASSAASLHVTFSLAPLTGRAIFRVLEELSLEDVEFREYLADARAEGGAALSAQLTKLAARLNELILSERLRLRLASDQRKLWEPDQQVQLPSLQTLEFYARTDRPASVATDLRGGFLQAGGPEVPLGMLGEAAEWVINRAAFSAQELFASFPYLEEPVLRKLVRELERRNLIYPYTPEL
jgi:ribosomal protein L16 Arg81 hydroxylase